MRITVGLYALAAGLLTTTLMAATPTNASRWRIVVEVENRAHFSDADLTRAERWVEKVYAEIGISVVWSPPVSQALGAFTFRRIESEGSLRPVCTYRNRLCLAASSHTRLATSCFLRTRIPRSESCARPFR
jgi:hypothetical protein